jgi:hypothetical protein
MARLLSRVDGPLIYIGDAAEPLAAESIRIDETAPRYGRRADGYGGKIPTRYRVRVDGRWRRVYVACWSNSGTAYIVRNGAGIEDARNLVRSF